MTPISAHQHKLICLQIRSVISVFLLPIVMLFTYNSLNLCVSDLKEFPGTKKESYEPNELAHVHKVISKCLLVCSKGNLALNKRESQKSSKEFRSW